MATLAQAVLQDVVVTSPVVRLRGIAHLFTANEGDVLLDDYDGSYWRVTDAEARYPQTRRLDAAGVMRPTPTGADLCELDSRHTLTHQEAFAELRGREFIVASDMMVDGSPLVYILLARRMPVERLALDDELAATGR